MRTLRVESFLQSWKLPKHWEDFDTDSWTSDFQKLISIQVILLMVDMYT